MNTRQLKKKHWLGQSWTPSKSTEHISLVFLFVEATNFNGSLITYLFKYKQTYFAWRTFTLSEGCARNRNKIDTALAHNLPNTPNQSPAASTPNTNMRGFFSAANTHS